MNARSMLASLFVCAGLLAGCDTATTTGPGIEPEIRNNTDSFEYQVSKVDRYSGTLTYNWSHTGTVANVNQSAALTGGTAQLVILDAAGAQVYSKDLTANGTFVTAAGQAGTWRIQVVYSNASGTLNFRAQKRP